MIIKETEADRSNVKGRSQTGSLGSSDEYKMLPFWKECMKDNS